MTFAGAIGLQCGDVLALVGAGGKTTLSLLLGLELLARGEPAACCATTMTLLPAPDPRIRVIFTSQETAAQAVRDALNAGQLPWVAGDHSSEHDPAPDARSGVVRPIALTEGKIKGADPSEIDRLHAALPDVTLIVEADGARHRWLKAPAEHEPQLPASTTVLSPVAHLGVIGKPLTEEFVHRPERVARIVGAPIGIILTPEMVAAVLAHRLGGRKGLRAPARFVPILTLSAPDYATLNVMRTCQALLETAPADRIVVAWLGEKPWTKVMQGIGA